MTYQMSGLILKKHVGGQKFNFRMPEDGADCEVTLSMWTQAQPWPSPGLEAYVIPGVCRHPREGSFPVMLKVFKFEVPERGERTLFLTDTLKLGSNTSRSVRGLPDDLHWMFYGFPFLWLGRTKINDKEVIAHLTRHIGGEKLGATTDFLGYKVADKTAATSWDHVPPDQRAELALQLVDMVRTLEKIGLVHGDLSHGNVLIGPGRLGNRVATLCDYDGYYFPRVAQLPRMLNGQPIRPIGTPEFQHPDVRQRFQLDTNATDAGLFVGTDRFAMGVLICEMMVWSTALKSALVRETLLSDQELNSRSLRALEQTAPDIRGLFPSGFELLEKAMTATGMWQAGDVDKWARANLPGPDEWEQCILTGGNAAWPKGSKPRLTVYRKVGNQPAMQREDVEISSAGANLGVINSLAPILATIDFTWKREDGKLELIFSGNDQVRTRRSGVGAWKPEAGTRPLTLSAGPGDQFMTDNWYLEFR
jgi:hypothetical protein